MSKELFDLLETDLNRLRYHYIAPFDVIQTATREELKAAVKKASRAKLEEFANKPRDVFKFFKVKSPVEREEALRQAHRDKLNPLYTELQARKREFILNGTSPDLHEFAKAFAAKLEGIK